MKKRDLNAEKDVIHLFENLKPVPPRDPAVAAQRRAAYLEQANSLRTAVSARPEERHIGWIEKFKNAFQRKEPKPMLHTLVALLVSLVFMVSGAGATVLAAQDALPNEALYGLKTLSENTRLSLTAQVQNQLRLLQEFSSRRVQEMLQLNTAGQAVPDPVANRFQNQVDSALQLAANLEAQQMNQALEQLRTMLQEQERQMVQASQAQDPALLQARLTLQERLRLVETGLQDPDQFRQELREQIRQQDRKQDQDQDQDQDQIQEKDQDQDQDQNREQDPIKEQDRDQVRDQDRTDAPTQPPGSAGEAGPEPGPLSPSATPGAYGPGPYESAPMGGEGGGSGGNP